MALLLNRVRVATPTTGTGSLSLGSAASGYQGFGAAGALDGSRYSYVIEDGTAWEIGEGVYTASGPSLSRNLIASSTGALLNLSGSASVYVSPLDRDLTPWVTTGMARNNQAWGDPGVSTEATTDVDVTPSEAEPFYARRRSTAATASSRTSTFLGTNRLLSTLQATQRQRGRYRFFLPDASYGSGATGARLAIGVFSGAFSNDILSGPTSNANIRGAWFRYDTSAGDTNWMRVERRDTTPANAIVTDTGIAFAPGLYEFTVGWGGPVGTTFDMALIRVGTGIARGLGMVGYAAMPLNIGFAMLTLTTVARSFDFVSYQQSEEMAL